MIPPWRRRPARAWDWADDWPVAMLVAFGWLAVSSAWSFAVTRAEIFGALALVGAVWLGSGPRGTSSTPASVKNA